MQPADAADTDTSSSHFILSHIRNHLPTMAMGLGGPQSPSSDPRPRTIPELAEPYIDNLDRLKGAPLEIRGNRAVMLEICRKGSTIGRRSGVVQCSTEELRADRAFVFEACKKTCGFAFQFAAEELLVDREFVFEVCNLHQGVPSETLQFAAEELWCDKAFMQKICGEIDGTVLEFASPELRADKEVVLAACTQDGWALEFAAPELCADKDVVRAACTEFGGALQFAAPELRADKEVVLAACTRHGEALQFASSELQADKEVVEQACAMNYGSLHYAAATLLSDPEILEAAARQFLSCVSVRLRRRLPHCSNEELSQDPEAIAAQSAHDLKENWRLWNGHSDAVLQLSAAAEKILGVPIFGDRQGAPSVPPQSGGHSLSLVSPSELGTVSTSLDILQSFWEAHSVHKDDTRVYLDTVENLASAMLRDVDFWRELVLFRSEYKGWRGRLLDDTVGAGRIVKQLEYEIPFALPRSSHQVIVPLPSCHHDPVLSPRTTELHSHPATCTEVCPVLQDVSLWMCRVAS